jgi:NAD(P)-dependent dehydrogenase (short-subunit alcohol dehydrogenase family)
MSDRHEHPIAVVTGANRGLGRAVAVGLARRGVDVVVAFRSRQAEAGEAVAEIRALGREAAALRLDTEEVESFAGFAADLERTLRERWGRDTFDFLVNNAGSGVIAPFAETSPEQLDRMLAVHVRGVYFLTQTLLPLVADGGSIVNVSTGLTRFTLPGYSAYAAAKGAVEVLTRYLAQELGPRGITVNTIAPGATGGTDFTGGILRDDEAVRASIAGRVALGRMGEPDDIAGAVAALLTSDSRWITGQRIEASGGQQL